MFFKNIAPSCYGCTKPHLKISFSFLLPMRGTNPDFNLANVPMKQN